MTSKKNLGISSALLTKAKELGADLVGFASVTDLKKAPSFSFAPRMPGIEEGIGTRENKLGIKPGEVLWPENAKTVMVIAVHHPEDKPEMDWWFGRVDPPVTGCWQRLSEDCANGFLISSVSESFIFPIMWKKAAPISKIQPFWPGWA